MSHSCSAWIIKNHENNDKYDIASHISHMLNDSDTFPLIHLQHFKTPMFANKYWAQPSFTIGFIISLITSYVIFYIFYSKYEQSQKMIKLKTMDIILRVSRKKYNCNINTTKVNRGPKCTTIFFQNQIHSQFIQI